MNFREIESIHHAFGVRAKCCLCGKRVPLLGAREHAKEHGYPLGGEFTLTIDGARIHETNTGWQRESPVVIRTSKWA